MNAIIHILRYLDLNQSQNMTLFSLTFLVKNYPKPIIHLSFISLTHEFDICYKLYKIGYC